MVDAAIARRRDNQVYGFWSVAAQRDVLRARFILLDTPLHASWVDQIDVAFVWARGDRLMMSTKAPVFGGL